MFCVSLSRMTASALGDRQMLPLQTKSTLIVINLFFGFASEQLERMCALER